MKKGDKEPLTFDKILLLPDYLEFIQNGQKSIDSCGKKEVIEKDTLLQTELDKATFIYQILTSHKKDQVFR